MAGECLAVHMGTWSLKKIYRCRAEFPRLPNIRTVPAAHANRATLRRSAPRQRGSDAEKAAQVFLDYIRGHLRVGVVPGMSSPRSARAKLVVVDPIRLPN